MFMRIAFITTVKNEEKNIELLLKSLLSQSKRPDQAIIVDGGSTDNTVKIAKYWISKVRSEDFRKKISFFVKKGNRSVGRNFAIKKARADIIVSSDSGCILEKDWIKNITKPFKNSKVDVVAGFYKGLAKSSFEKSLIPYVLVMNPKPDDFFPASRSVAFRKFIWKKAGEYPKEYSYNEDYIFARKLNKIGAEIILRKNAIVFWLPRKKLIDAFIMFFKFAYGDAESGIARPKAIFILLRYTVVFWLIIYSLIFNLPFITKIIFYILILYIVWAILKNYGYVKDKRAIFWLPILQFTSDLAVILGSVFGFSRGLWDTQMRQ